MKKLTGIILLISILSCMRVVCAQELVVMDLFEDNADYDTAAPQTDLSDFTTGGTAQEPAADFESGQISDTTVADHGTGQTQEESLPVPDEGEPQSVQETPAKETVYVSARILPVYDTPASDGKELLEFRFGAGLTRTGICDNGYSHVVYQGNSGEYEGYVLSYALSEQPLIEKVNEKAVISKDTDILDYPGRRDGEITGEVLEEDIVTLCGSVGDTWSRILYESETGTKDGYILTSCIRGHETALHASAKDGELSKSSGEGVFADAVTGVTKATITESNGGVLIGSPQSVGESVTLIPLGIFRITHYCQCSICCGPYANGITATGVTAVTNHTIAVSPAQIPYGSRVAINGQVYVAEDCGSAIRTNCIDIYVASHDEALAKGVFYTEVYLIQ